VSIGLFFLAPTLPYLLGQSYLESIEVIRLLAWLPLFILPRLFIRAVLITSDQQTVAMRVGLIGAVINIILNIMLIQIWGWTGAVISIYLSEITMILYLYSLLRKRIKLDADIYSEGVIRG
jgi:O-antigen/teichoic acid export membrane protein